MSKPRRGKLPREREKGQLFFWLEIILVSSAFSLVVYFGFEPKYSPFSFVYFIGLLYFIRKFLKESTDEPIKKFNILLFTFVGTLLWFFLQKALIEKLNIRMTTDFVYFSIPYAFSPLVLAFLFEPIISLYLTIIISLGVLGITGNPAFSLFSFITGLSSIYGVVHYSRMKRGSIYRTIFLVILPISIVFLLLINLFSYSSKDLAINGLAIFINVIILAFLASFLIPVLEYVFKIVSPLRLVELSNTNLEIFKKMALEAPGTFHHSLMVATISERAADAIGANSLLARVGALYHDIGKLKMPQYFTENQVNIPNPHAGKPPSLSSLIIINHVKEGIEMGRNLGLPQEIIDFIAQHHGTTLVKFFYLKAKEMKMEVDESAFRYPGPRPRTKETAIVMIADGCEAAVNSLEDQDEERIRETVDGVIKYLMGEGQFDEAPITFKEIRIVKGEVIKILSAIYHKRIEYPEEEIRNGSKQTEKNKDR